MEGIWRSCGRGVVGLGCRFLFLFEKDLLGKIGDGIGIAAWQCGGGELTFDWSTCRDGRTFVSLLREL
jgi:hypothetical protein